MFENVIGKKLLYCFEAHKDYTLPGNNSGQSWHYTTIEPNNTFLGQYLSEAVQRARVFFGIDALHAGFDNICFF